MKMFGNDIFYMEMIPSRLDTHHIFNLTFSDDTNTVLKETRNSKSLNTVIVGKGYKRYHFYRNDSW